MFGAGNVITFDGLVYDFPGVCQYEMVSFSGTPDFKVRKAVVREQVCLCSIMRNVNILFQYGTFPFYSNITFLVSSHCSGGKETMFSDGVSVCRCEQ